MELLRIFERVVKQFSVFDRAIRFLWQGRKGRESLDTCGFTARLDSHFSVLHLWGYRRSWEGKIGEELWKI